MTVWNNTGDAVSNGVAITTGSQPASGTPFNQIVGTIAGDTTDAVFGTGCYKTSITSADTAAKYLLWSLSGQTTATARCYFRIGSAPTISPGGEPLITFRSASARAISIQLGPPDSTGIAIHVDNAAFAEVNNSLVIRDTAPTYPLVFAIDMAVDVGTTTSNGKVKIAYYNQDGSYAFGTTGPIEVTGINAGGIGLASISFGRYGTSSGTTLTYEMDALSAADSYALIGPYTAPPSNTPPTANAGPDQNNVLPWSTVTLDGSGSTDNDGTVASYAWTQTAGTTAALSSTTAQKPTLTAPATISGDTLTYSLTVTDNSGAASTSPDTVSIGVKPVTERAVVSGAEIPMRVIGATP